MALGNYLKFSSTRTFTIALGLNYDNTVPWDGVLQFSSNNTVYRNFTTTRLRATAGLNSSTNMYELYIRGSNNTKLSGPDVDVPWTLYSTNDDVYCEGNIENLLDYQTVANGGHPEMGNQAFVYLFNGSNGWTRLKTPPALGSTTLAPFCYANMFSGCTGLIKVPELPATEFIVAEYGGMFSGCSSLIISDTPTATATKQWTIPSGGVCESDYVYMADMFYECAGTRSSNDLELPSGSQKTYYVEYAPVSDKYVSITTEPQSQETTIQANVQPLSVVVDTNFPSVTYQWYEKVNDNWVAISGETSSTYTPTLTAATQYFKVIITGDATHSTESNIVGLHNTSGNYLTFSSSSSFSLPLMWRSNTYSKLQYSTDTIHWTAWNGEYINATLDGSTYKLYIRGKLEGLSGQDALAGGIDITTEGQVSCSGNIETLLNWEKVAENQHPTFIDYQFQDFFMGQTCLLSAPDLPTTSITPYCYSQMFNGCSSLTTAPNLPATTLANYCYQSMFKGCSSLINSPIISAETLAPYCCKSMFQNCSALVSPPVLSAMTMANQCYQWMFAGCTNLGYVPELPATTLAAYCYYNMFWACTSIIVLPMLPATTLATGCYQYMFEDCTNIKVYSTSTAEHGVEYRIPNSGTGTTVANALDNMFVNTGGDVTTPVINTTYYIETVIVITTHPQSQIVTEIEDVLAKTVIANALIGTLTYQWQESLDNIVWANISGATSSSYLPTAVLGTKYYRCKLEVVNIQTLYTNSCYLSYYNEDFTLLIRDRTQADIDYVTELRYKMATDTALSADKAKWNAGLKGAYNYVDLNRVGRMLNFLQYYCPSGTIVYPYELKWDWTANEIPTQTQINQYLANVQVIKTAYPQTTVSVPTTISSYGNANDIEQLLYEIRDLV